MAGADFPWRLYWAQGRGVVRQAGYATPLTEAPLLAGQRFEYVDYVPHQVAQVGATGERVRDMLPTEIHAARELLGLTPDTVCVVCDNTRRYRGGS